MDPLRVISEAATRLRDGGLVAFPTETVYGLGADAFSADAVARVFAAKGRPATNPLIVHVTGPEMARTVAAEWPEHADRLTDAFWPGPLTLVLPKQSRVPDEVTAGGATVAVRAPDHPVAMALLEAFGGPIVGPSANPSGYISPTRADHVRSHFDPEDVYVLDGGPCRTGIESTVLGLVAAEDEQASGLTAAHPVVLRRGAIGSGEIAGVLGVPVGDAHSGADEPARPGEPTMSPGVLGPHYQPRARVGLCADMTEAMAALARVDGHAVVLTAPGEPAAVPPPHQACSMPADPVGYAGALYAALYRADESAATSVLIVIPGGTDHAIWHAVRDRLSRAAR